MILNSGKLCFLVMSFAVGFVWLKEKLFVFDFLSSQPHYQLVLGVLSSRDHFQQRGVIRNTWLRDYKESNMNQKVLIKFVVTALDCKVPPEYRVDSYTCKDEEIWGPEMVEGNAIQFEHVQSSDICSISPFPASYKFVAVDFYIAHSIILHSLAIPIGYHKSDGTIILELRDLAHENQLIVSASFHLMSLKSSDSSCFLIKPVPRYVLPKGFHGTIFVQCFRKSSTFNCLGIEGVMDIIKHPAVQFSPLLRYGEEIDSIPALTEPKDLSKLALPAYILFDMHDKDFLEHHRTNRPVAFRNWEIHLSNVDRELAKEIEDHGDIITVEDPSSSSTLVEVYRNLPLKLLSFYSWSHLHLIYDFIGKVDDDTYVNVSNILQYLNKPTSTKYSWHGNFRRHIDVERFGKWTEMTYTSSSYPTFACGTGSVISRDVSAWLALNGRYLHSYQGEDVSMGIWLSAIQPHLVHDDRWVCDDGCSSRMFVSAQHNTSSILRMWRNNHLCKNPCLCEKT